MSHHKTSLLSGFFLKETFLVQKSGFPQAKTLLDDRRNQNPCKTSEMEHFATIANDFWLLTIVAELSILDVYWIHLCPGV